MSLRPAALLALLTALVLAAAPAWAQKVRLSTDLGDIVVELDAEKAPKSSENFLRYVRDKHYDGTIFHRVIETFMIQGGGYRADLSEKQTRAPIPLESGNGLSNQRGTLAMARTAVPDSATSQFFINVVDPGLDKASARDGHGYAVFGKVVEGMDVVDKIKALAVRENGQHRHFPVETVTLRRATLEK
jgi:peptidyl-prolyl cis-trans isomerase A (cyclophilin A)